MLLSTSIYETYGMAWGPYSSSSNEPQSFFQTPPGPNLEYFGGKRTIEINMRQRERPTTKAFKVLFGFLGWSRTLPKQICKIWWWDILFFYHFIKEGWLTQIRKQLTGSMRPGEKTILLLVLTRARSCGPKNLFLLMFQSVNVDDNVLFVSRRQAKRVRVKTRKRA